MPGDYVGHEQSEKPDCAPRRLLRKKKKDEMEENWRHTSTAGASRETIATSIASSKLRIPSPNQTVHTVESPAHRPHCSPPRQLSTSIPGRDPLLRVKPPAATRKEQAVTTDQSTDFVSNLRAVTTTTTTTTTPPPRRQPSLLHLPRRTLAPYTTPARSPSINHRISRRNRRAPRLS